MRYRVTFLAGVAAGFVIGARAGRERYEQMKNLARRAADNPALQQAAGTAAAQASGLAKSAADQVQQRAPRLAEMAKRTGASRIQERIPSRWRGGGTSDDTSPVPVADGPVADGPVADGSAADGPDDGS